MHLLLLVVVDALFPEQFGEQQGRHISDVIGFLAGVILSVDHLRHVFCQIIAGILPTQGGRSCHC